MAKAAKKATKVTVEEPEKVEEQVEVRTIDTTVAIVKSSEDEQAQVPQEVETDGTVKAEEDETTLEPQEQKPEESASILEESEQSEEIFGDRDAQVLQAWTVDIRERFNKDVTKKDLRQVEEELVVEGKSLAHLYCNDEQAKKVAKMSGYKHVKITVE